MEIITVSYQIARRSYLFMYSFLRSLVIRLAVLTLVVLSLTPMANRAWSQPLDEEHNQVSLNPMLVSIEEALTSHRKELSDLEIQINDLDLLSRNFNYEISMFGTENVTHRQLLLVSQVQIGLLESALIKNRLTVYKLTNRLKTLQSIYDETAIKFKKTADRLDLANQQMAVIQKSQRTNAQKQEINKAIKELVQVLGEKKHIGDSYLRIYEAMIDAATKALVEQRALGIELAKQLEKRQRTSLFTSNPLYRQAFNGRFPDMWAHFGDRIGKLINPLTWQSLWAQIKLKGFFRWVKFTFWLIFIFILQSRSKAILERFEKAHPGPDWYYRRLSVYLIRHSLFFLGMVLLFGIYRYYHISLLDMGLVQTLLQLFLLLLFIRWAQDFLEKGYGGSTTVIGIFFYQELKRLLWVFRPILITIVFLFWLVGPDSLLALFTQDLLISGTLIWCIVFWRRVQMVLAKGRHKGETRPDPRRIALMRWWSFLFAGGGVLISLFGYQSLATYWNLGWIQTWSLLLWGWLSLNAIREWQNDHRTSVAVVDSELLLSSSYHLRGSIIKIIQVAWFIILVRGIIWAWDSSGLLMSHIIKFINHMFIIGNLQLSINGFINAVTILFVTFLAVQIGRSLFREKVLDKKTYESGFKSTILTIFSYFLWGLGLLLAIRSIGVDATSLAVIFGALSVGIGFGLQTIFNNFISGLILLFERPIQVGDVVEIRGMWAEVKKINVRATVVHTFDNAAVIIPNSDFISEQVTNWTFKDKRMRRSLEVGVAYGSDIDLVQKTLLDIANSTSGVMKDPQPNVIFVDHADSVLLFRLRIWVQINDFWLVPSNIRFDIDNRFRELGIEIAFPQRDLHVRSLPNEGKTSESNSVSSEFRNLDKAIENKFTTKPDPT